MPQRCLTSRVRLRARSTLTPMLATLKYGWPFTSPRSIACSRPLAMTSAAATGSVGTPSVAEGKPSLHEQGGSPVERSVAAADHHAMTAASRGKRATLAKGTEIEVHVRDLDTGFSKAAQSGREVGATALACIHEHGARTGEARSPILPRYGVEPSTAPPPLAHPNARLSRRQRENAKSAAQFRGQR